ncbi:hypothetical protein B5X24_HaOG214307 [Helicoverpa armigera]|nr:hypothetical protein B5X24_HaOG214307 [Helicoverpa armigera]
MRCSRRPPRPTTHSAGRWSGCRARRARARWRRAAWPPAWPPSTSTTPTSRSSRAHRWRSGRAHSRRPAGCATSPLRPSTSRPPSYSTTLCAVSFTQHSLLLTLLGNIGTILLSRTLLCQVYGSGCHLNIFGPCLAVKTLWQKA